ncbi:hypothetical protein CICLE_v10023207mg [Citrus x clementina]|uniref:Uncharacterized protein n=1 Tax=Citrus clementina TaxID=85681 RepID=V4TVT3_CITCL|nr:hypothetical protein CICLE_v10023207mg [Citrus x clementina]
MVNTVRHKINNSTSILTFKINKVYAITHYLLIGGTVRNIFIQPPGRQMKLPKEISSFLIIWEIIDSSVRY